MKTSLRFMCLRRVFPLVVLTLGAALVSVPLAKANVISYTDEATWEAAVSSPVSLPGTSSLSVVSSTNSITSDADAFPPLVSTTVDANAPNYVVTYDLAGGIQDLAFDYSSTGDSFQLTIDGESFTLDSASSTFFGITDTDAFASFTLGTDTPTGSSAITIDDVQYAPSLASPVTVPEPDSLALMGIGALAGLAAVRHKKKRS